MDKSRATGKEELTGIEIRKAALQAAASMWAGVIAREDPNPGLPDEVAHGIVGTAHFFETYLEDGIEGLLGAYEEVDLDE